MIQLLTYKQAAKHVGLCTKSLQALVASGRIPVYRIGPNGGTPRFSAEDLDEYIKKCRKVGPR